MHGIETLCRLNRHETKTKPRECNNCTDRETHRTMAPCNHCWAGEKPMFRNGCRSKPTQFKAKYSRRERLSIFTGYVLAKLWR